MNKIVLLICIFILLFSCETRSPCIGCGNNEEVKNLKNIITSLNNRLSYIELLDVGTHPYCTSTNNYQIVLKDTLLREIYKFEIEEYIIETGGNIREIPTSKICSVVEELMSSEQETVRELIERIEINSTLFGIELNNLQYILAEIYVALATLSQNSKIEIFIKGYADGGASVNWAKKISEIPLYKYDTIKYLPVISTQVGSLNPTSYQRNATTYHIVDSLYYNKDLPFLRAEFVKNDFILPFIASCSASIQDIHILQGYEFRKSVIDPNKRMAQIFVGLVCDE